MDFSLTEEQQARYDAVAAFGRTLDFDGLPERDHESEFSGEGWQRCADFGIQSMAVPAPYSDGDDVDFFTAMLSMEALGYGSRDAGLTFALNAHMWTVALPIAQAASDAQKAKWLPGMASGEIIGAHVITEPDTGSDVFALATTATRCEGGYLLNGRKTYISLGPIADVALVFATVDPSQGKWGVTAFIVDASADGYERSATRQKMGLRTVPIGDIVFRDCFVPEDARMGPEGSGVGLSSSFLEWERCCILASQLGIMRRQLESCIEFARKRRQFGKPIGKFQAVSHRIVDMQLRLETCRLLLHKVAWLKHTGRPAMLEAALLKLHLSECFSASSLDAIRIHGGKGYMTEYSIERELRDAVGGLIYAGTSDIQKNIVAGLLGL
jgi:alkylation response protein AidB-like acyl-CoA dehydrogenase